MADQQELTIVVEAVDKASKQLKQVENDLNELSKSAKKNNDISKIASGGADNLFGAFVKGGLVLKGVEMAFSLAQSALNGLKGVMAESVEISSQYERSLKGLEIISGRFGESQDKATAAAKSLAEDGLVSVSTAANGLQKLMQGGLGLDQAIEMMRGYKDQAAFGRADTIKYDQAVQNLAESFYTENSMIGNLSGQTENWNFIIERGAQMMGKNVSQLTQAEKAQAKYLGQQKLNLLVQGDSIRYANTYAGQVSRIENAQRALGDALGSVLKPALFEIKSIQGEVMSGLMMWASRNEDKLRAVSQKFATMISNIFNGFTEFLRKNSDAIYSAVNFVIQVFQRLTSRLRAVVNVVQIVINGFQALASNLTATGQMIYNALRGDWEGVSKAQEDWLQRSGKIVTDFQGNLQDLADSGKQYQDSYTFDLKTWWDGIEGIEKQGNENIAAINQKGNDELSKQQMDARKKMAKENEKYKREVEKRAKDFQESFDDLIIQHRDTIQQMTEDLAKESRDYQKNVVEMLDEYNKSMEEIKASHRDKTDSVMADMEEERKKAEEEIEKLTEAYNEEVGLIKQEGEDRVSNLQVQLDKERALGDKANADKIASLEAMIEFEKKGLTTSLDDKQAKHEEEIADINENLNAKLEILQKSLEDENVAYEKAMAERKLQYEEDVADAKASYEEKRAEMQKELDAELAIREKYAEDFKRVGDRIALDDITRLVNKYNEEKAEAERQHLETLAEISGDAYEQGKAVNENMAAGMESSYPKVKSQIDKIKSDISDMSQQVSNFSAGETKSNPWWMSTLGVGAAGNGGGGAWAQGGIATQPGIVGEAGPEVVLPLSFPKRMSQIMQSLGMGGGGGKAVTQNFYVTVNNPMDVDVLMERAGFAMRSQGGLT